MTSDHKLLGLLVLSLSLVSLPGCSGARKPVVYPNAHFQSVGDARARADVADCMRLAEGFGAPRYGGADVAQDTAAGAAIGGAAAGAWALVRDYGDAGNRALAGAASGGAAGLVRGSLRSGEPSGTFRGFVNRCLSDRGYDVVGWE